MLIMHTTCHRQFGGLEKRIYNESCQMAEKGHKIIIAAPAKSPLMVKSLKRGFICIPVEFTAKSSLRDYFALRRIYKIVKPDVLNTHGNTDSKIALAATLQLSIKRTDTEEKRTEKILVAKRYGKDKIAIKSSVPCTILSRHISADVKPSWYNRLLYKRLSRYIFTTADYTTDHLISNLNVAPDRIFTLPSGILPPAELPGHERARGDLAAEINRAEARTDLNSASRFIGFVGRVSEDKGVSSIIKAFLLIAELITKKDPAYHLVIVGHGESKFIDEMRNMVDQTRYKGFVHFTGFKENTWPYYRAFDCTILASREVEGISQSLLEAMYARSPVAGSKIGGTCDIIRDGETGLLFSPDNSEEIAHSILYILNDKVATESRIDAAFKMVLERYSIDSMVSQILKCYQKALFH